MNFDHLYAWCIYASSLPFLIIILILIHYVLLRLHWRWCKWLGKKGLRFYPSTYALGLALQFIQIFHQPSMAYVVEVKQDEDEDADQDDSGDPNAPEARLKHFHRQLRRIRHGDPVDRLELRM